jgi:peptidoglycan/xylan/chitin deacetylase (PgdA/CDA1 family)
MRQLEPGSLRWLSSPALSASAAIHLGAACATALHPRAWPWALGAVAANHAVLTAAGLWPKSRLLGPNWVRLPAASGARGEVAITIDDGPDPAVTPQVLAQLDAARAPATFFCVGERVQRHADLAREIVRRGHSIENHSQRHRHDFSLLGPAGMRAEIALAQDGISRAVGSAPRFFRAPAGLRNPFLDPVLNGLSLKLATVNGNAEIVYRRLATNLRAGDILLLHDGHAARDSAGRPVILEVLPRLIGAIRAAGLTPVTLRAAL